MKNLFFTITTCVVLSLTSSTIEAQSIFGFQNNNAAKETQLAAPVENLPTIKYTAQQFTSLFTKAIPKRMMMITEECKKWHFKFAQLLNREVESLTNTALFSVLNDWWATRYRYGGTTRNGIDCSAFVGMLVDKAYALKLPRTAREQYQASKRIALAEMKEGDLVFFNTTGGISHVGLYLGNGYFTHSSSSKGVTISNLSEDYYKARFIAGGRITQ